MLEKIPFLEMFPCCETMAGNHSDIKQAQVISATVSRESMTMAVKAWFPAMPAPAELSGIEWLLASEYGLRGVTVSADWPKEAKPAAAAGPARAGKVLYGKAIKGKSIPMNTADPDMKSVTVTGRVFATDNRAIQRLGASVLQFDMTDGSGSLRVSKYIAKEEDQSILAKISAGMYLTVSGKMKFNSYSHEPELEPRHIQTAEAPAGREDTAPVKRVELHLHTQMSAMDALSDPGAIIKKAAGWGMSAIAITDHGVAQAFPAAQKAAKGIKVIFGLEGYYVNDVDEDVPVRGEGTWPLSGEFVAFDIETTGLSDETDRVTEIGAVVFRNGEECERFQTFVDPHMPIPADIRKLTGITDKDVAGAPEEAAAVADFLAFVGGRPLCAHNADFDVGFITAAAERAQLSFKPLYMDTLSMARALLPDMKRFKLDMVADRLSLPPFNHHRASDDAYTCGRILVKLLAMLGEKGARDITDINGICADLRRAANKHPRTRHITLLVKNRVGLKNLYELISQSHLHHFRKVPIIPKSLLMRHREGLIVGSACEAGEFFQAILRHRSRMELMRIGSFYDYFEIMPIANNAFMLDNGQARSVEELRDMNRRVIDIARALDKPVCATGDVHFTDPEDEIYRHILLNSKGFSDADKSMPLYFRTTDDMLDEFSYLGEELAYEVVVENTNMIADMVEGQVPLLPELRLYPPVIENSDGQLKDLVYGRLRELYGPNPEKLITDRVEHEMNTILGRHFDVIYMSAQKLVSDSVAHGYLVGSRGSVGSSIVAYLSGITEVNSLPAHYLCPKCFHTDFESGKGYGCGADMPDKNCPHCGIEMKKEGFDIPFATFLGIKGDKVPDIDLNFSGEYQANAHAYTKTLFGDDHVFKAGTVGTIAEKTAFGYVKKYAEERELIMSQAEMSRLAQGIVGVKRTTGQHPGGLVIIPQNMDVTDFCPVQHPADDADSGVITTHLEYHFMEDYLLKLDELGHDNPTMINMLERLTGTDATKIRLDDGPTMSLFKSPAALGAPEDDPIIGKTGSIGIPEFGTGFTRQMLVDTQPDKFDMLVRLSGFSHGTNVWVGNAQDLIKSGTATVSQTIGCRDDIMLYLISLGIDDNTAFKSMENVRKNRPLTDEQLQAMRDHNVPEWYIESCNKIEYLFPKAHAVAYVLMAFRIAWYKVHYPLAFYAALFYRRSQKDGFDAEMMMGGANKVRAKLGQIRANPNATAKEEDLCITLEMVYEFYMRGFDFAPMDFYRSDAFQFVPEGDKLLRVPFVAVSGLGQTAAANLAAAAEGGRTYVSVEEIAAACPKVSAAHIEALRRLGAFGAMPETSQMTLFDL